MAQHYDITWLKQQTHVDYFFFWGHTSKQIDVVDKSCFSQWFEAPFSISHFTFKTAEHWMMAQKAWLFDDDEHFEQILASDTPSDAKKLGRLVTNYDDEIWSQHKFDIVKWGSIYKFLQHPEMAAFLRSTGDKVIVEAAPRDTIWGIGLGQDNPKAQNVHTWRGLNLLGFALMEARDYLKALENRNRFYKAGMPEVPWLAHPFLDPQDIFWRMGSGETLAHAYVDFYKSLTESEKAAFDLSYPLPYNWRDFYNVNFK